MTPIKGAVTVLVYSIMAFLKRIEVLGFKSFVERTSINLSSGISAIVGPNGCGKSNLVDAVRWVLGEQNPRLLRAEKMEDILFNGTEERKRIGVAEVTLIFNNERKLIPLDFSEVELRRRLYRSGESEYLINRQLVRLKDVRDLFLDTGVGKNAYSLMEQGRIDLMLSSKPEERRQVFDEAAGISRYLVRGVEASQKLRQTRQNIIQLETQFSETKRSRDVLIEQAERAENFRGLQRKMFSAERDLELIRLREFEERLKKIRERIDFINKEYQEYQDSYNEESKKLHHNTNQSRELDLEVVELRRQLYGFELKQSNLEDQINLAQQRIDELKHTLKGYRDRDQISFKKLEILKASLSEKKKEINIILNELDNLDLQWKNITKSIEEIEQEIQSNEKLIIEASVRAKNKDGSLEELRIKLRKITDIIVEKLDSKLQDEGYSLKERLAIEEDISGFIADLRKFLDSKEVINQNIKVSLRKSVNNLEISLRKYKLLISFFDQFLSSTGIMTEKRQLDEKLGETLFFITQTRKTMDEARQKNQQLVSTNNANRGKLKQLEVSRARSQTQNNALENECLRIETDMSEHQSARSSLAHEESDAAQAIEAVSRSLLDYQTNKLSLANEEKVQLNRLKKVQLSIEESNKDNISSQNALRNLEKKIEGTKADLQRLGIQETELVTEIRSTLRSFQEIHAQDLSQYELDMPEVESTKELRSILDQLKTDMRELGQVNLMASDEFKEADKKFQFLNDQLNDLNIATKDLVKVSDEINTESSKLFLDTFNEIRNAFQFIFRRLFGGGRTEIKLSNTDDVLNAGIDFYVQPPGKKLENIDLLSGGERSLTAVALLFAVFSVKPSPFCVLDEIDAALDDQNIDRLVELLLEFSEKSQFLVVTHNKKTASGASNLFGFTMEEKGISKIVTLKLTSLNRNETNQ